MKITLIMAMTADGKIARHNTHYPDWTGKADKKMFKHMTTSAGVVIMGSRTYGTIGKPLPQRLNWVMTRSPQRFASSEQLVFSDDPPSVIVDKLVARGYSTAALTGGPTINSLFAQARLIDYMVLTVTPKLFGQGLSLFAEPMDADLELLSHRELEPGILVLHYRCRYP